MLMAAKVAAQDIIAARPGSPELEGSQAQPEKKSYFTTHTRSQSAKLRRAQKRKVKKASDGEILLESTGTGGQSDSTASKADHVVPLRFGMVGPLSVRARNGCVFFIPKGMRAVRPRDDKWRGTNKMYPRFFTLEPENKETEPEAPKHVLTHVRSKAAKARRNAQKKRGNRKFRGVQHLDNVLEYGQVPIGRYKYHEDRYRKAGKPFVLTQSEGFRLKHRRKFDLPEPVARALIRIYTGRRILLPKKKDVVEATQLKIKRHNIALEAHRRRAKVAEQIRIRNAQIAERNRELGLTLPKAGRLVGSHISLLGGRAGVNLW
jgi:hypothetical protein